MANINGYQTIGELKSANSGYAKWGFAKKNGMEFFIKEFLSPIYPLDATVLSKEQILHKRQICNNFEAEKRVFYNELNKCATGNIVTVIDFFRFGSRYYTVTEKVDAAKIDPMEIFRLGLDQKILIMKIILHCVNTLHENHIVHGDIKPDNILFKVTKKGKYTAKIIDFDSSFLESSPPKNEDEFQGDLVYLAPESFLFIAEEEGGVLSTKIDVFALGVLFHQYMSGQLPGYDTSKYDYAFEAVLDGSTLSINSMIPENIGNIIAKMLDRDPEVRPTVGEAFSMLSGGAIPVLPKKEAPKPAAADTAKTFTTGGGVKFSSSLIKTTMRTKAEPTASAGGAPAPLDGSAAPDVHGTPSAPRSAGSFFKKADDLM